jgi:branched-chain amino acid transport system ATP-binding protein
VLELRNASTRYGPVQVLWDVSFDVQKGEIVAIIGANGAGKSSLIRSIFGMERAGGSIRFDGRDIARLPPHVICNLGIGQVAEGRQVFPNMTVRENLEMGAVVPRARAGAAQAMERVYALFPRLAERRRQLAGTLSGGEQQMLAIARGLMSDPEILMVDELSLGLAPVVLHQLFETLKTLKEGGLTIVLVEQNVHLAFAISDHAYVIAEGRLFTEGPPEALADMPEIRRAYLGL